MSLSLSSGNSLGSLTQQSQNGLQNQSIQALEILSPTTKNNMNFSLLVQNTLLSDEKLMTTDFKGNRKALNSSGSLYSQLFSFSIAKSISAHKFQMQLGYESASTYYSSNSQRFSYAFANQYGATYGGELKKSISNSPENYYYDNLTARYQARPTTINSLEGQLHWQQPWSQFYKSRIEFLARSSNEERPSHAGVVLKQVYTEDYLQSLRWDLGLISENRQESLRNERGYLSTYWTEIAYNFGINYNFWLAPSYAFVIEDEKNSKTEGILNRDLRVAVDIMGLKFQYLAKGWSTFFKFEILETNTNLKSQQGQGGVQWDI